MFGLMKRSTHEDGMAQKDFIIAEMDETIGELKGRLEQTKTNNSTLRLWLDQERAAHKKAAAERDAAQAEAAALRDAAAAKRAKQLANLRNQKRATAAAMTDAGVA